MAHRIVLLSFVSLGLTVTTRSAAADQEATAADGSVVLLHADGTWTYKAPPPPVAGPGWTPEASTLIRPKGVVTEPPQPDPGLTVEWEGRMVPLQPGETLADALAREGASSPQSTGRAPVAGNYGRWRVEVEKDPMDDRWNVTASNTSVESTFQPAIGDPKAFLLVRCKSGRMFDLYVSTPVVLDADLSDLLSGRVRYDDAPAVAATFSRSTDYAAAFFLNEGGTVAGLLSSKMLRVELTPHDSGPAVAAFDLEGASAALAEVDAACPHAIP